MPFPRRSILSQMPARDARVGMSGRDEARRFFMLASSYSIGLTLAAVGFVYYVLFPVWVWFAYTSIRMPSTGALRVAARRLMVSVVLWISFSIPLFFFFRVFGYFAYAAELSALVLGTVVVYLAAHPFTAADPRAARARFVGLGAGLATAADLVVVSATATFGAGIVVGGLPLSYLFLIAGFVIAVLAAASFERIAVRARKRIVDTPEA